MHEDESCRDIPRTCICTWRWDAAERAYKIEQPKPGCPWHTTQGRN